MDGMKPDWLAQLAPSHAPPAPGWWPLAPGWWALALIGVCAGAAILVWQTRRPVRLRRAALRELAQLEKKAASAAELAGALERLLRRYAVARYGREAVAGLSGRRWIDFVAAHGGTDWQGQSGAALLQAAYGGSFEPDSARWISGARAFFKFRT